MTITSSLSRTDVTVPRAATTHATTDAAGLATSTDTGTAALVLSAGRGWQSATQLLAEVTTIGSRDDAMLRLPGLCPIQAVVVRTPDGLDRLEVLDSDPDVRVDGVLIGVGEGATLHHGAVVELGLWSLTYRSVDPQHRPAA